jgi:conjugal transfer pilus assembly protein TraU
MKAIARLVPCLFALGLAAGAGAGECQGEFANPVTDVCWSCAFPISLGGMQLMSMGQEDTSNPSNLICVCSNPPKIGVSTSFWEPVRSVDVTRTPYCMVSLGGIELDPGFRAPEGEVREQDDLTKQSFYQVHWYVNPIMYYLELLLDDRCLERSSFDVAYLTEIDPLWSDDELVMILNPDVYLFGGPIAQAACAADCVASTAGFGSNTLFWCAGCNGSAYPFNGHVQAHVSGVQASSLLVQRMTSKLHREGVMWAASGSEGQCGYYPQPVMDKTNYKYQMLYPVPQTEKINDRCCQPYGRTTVLWGAGKQIPYIGEDYAYMIFRKRNCCAGAAIVGGAP